MKYYAERSLDRLQHFVRFFIRLLILAKFLPPCVGGIRRSGLIYPIFTHDLIWSEILRWAQFRSNTTIRSLYSQLFILPKFLHLVWEVPEGVHLYCPYFYLILSWYKYLDIHNLEHLRDSVLFLWNVWFYQNFDSLCRRYQRESTDIAHIFTKSSLVINIKMWAVWTTSANSFIFYEIFNFIKIFTPCVGGTWKNGPMGLIFLLDIS